MTGSHLVPLPAHVDRADAGSFRLTGSVRVTGDLETAAHLIAALESRTGIRGGARAGVPDDGEPTISLRRTGGAPESYRIAVTAASVVISGADQAGLFYGAQTLRQLLSEDADGWFVPAVSVADAPRFAYRGVMLDVARHFHPVETVTAYIDRAVSLKFNVLHLHLSDDQGWRLELASRPELTDRASGTSVGGDPGGFFTRDEYRAILAYAAARHMTVIPEIDLPGHTHAVSLAYPELCEPPVITDAVRETIRDFGGGVPESGVAYEGIAVGFSSLRLRDEATYAFLADVLGELAELTPGPFLHVGGDEALGTSPSDFAYAMERVTRLVTDLGKTPIAWHEAGAAGELAPGTIGQYWGYVTPTEGMDEKLRAFVRRGGRAILSPADAIYLDMKFDADSPLGLTWANGVTSARRAYGWDPAAVADGVGDGDGEILGVEAVLWTETVRTLDDIDALAFPRIAAAAEIAWSPATSPDRTWESFRARVSGLGAVWTTMGIAFTPLPEIEWTAR